MPKVSDAHRQARRREILDAAAACFARQGFHRTSMQDIVRESGISAGLVYRYFAGKDDVIAAIVGEWHEHRTRLLTGSAVEREGAAPESPADGPAPEIAADGAAPESPAASGSAAASGNPAAWGSPAGSGSPAGVAPEGPAATGGAGHPLPAYLAMLRAIGAPEAAADLRLGVQVWAEALRSPAIGELTRGGVDRFRKLAAGAIRDAEREGGLPAGVEPDALARVLIAIYQGLMLQTAWDSAVDNDAFVRAVAGLVGTLTEPARGHRSGGA